MLSGKEILKKFNSIISRRRAIIITMSVLIGLSSVLPKNAHAVSKETSDKFLQTYRYVSMIMENNKETKPDSSIVYNIPNEEQIKINKMMDKAMGSLEKDVRSDIKNENWGICQAELEILSNLAHTFGQRGYENRIWKLIEEVHSDFTNHIDTKIEGVYTVKGSGKVYCIGKANSKSVSLGREIAQTRARNQLLIHLKTNQAQISLSRPLFYQTNQDGTISSVVEFQGEIKYYRTTITAKELAKRLEQEGRFLPLK